MKKNILFVDDEVRVLQALRRMLRSERHNWNSVFAESGQQALELCETNQFEVVVSDMRMPNMDGAALLAEISRRWPETVRMVLTGQCDNATVMRCVDLAHQFLPKPCDADMLKSTVEQAFALRIRLDNHHLLSEVSRATAIPSFPASYEMLVQELDQEKPSVQRLQKIVSDDVGMTAKVMQLVSSNFFGIQQPCTNPDHAVQVLGVNILRELVQHTGSFQPIDPEQVDVNQYRQWMAHGFRVGRYARAIARDAADEETASYAWLSGVLHCSSLYFVMRDNSVSLNDGLVGLELELLPLLSAYILTMWGLPSAVGHAITYMNEPSLSGATGFTPLTALHVAHGIYQAELMCDNDSLTPDAIRNEMDGGYLEQIGCIDLLDHWCRLCHEEPQSVATVS